VQPRRNAWPNTIIMTETYDPNAQVGAIHPGTAAKPNARGGSDVPLCFVIDPDAGIRHSLSLVLHGAGLDTEEFADGGGMLAALGQRRPDLIFLDIGLDSGEAVETMIGLARQGYFGLIQLISNRGAAVLEHIRGIGSQRKLQMLPVLKKPFDMAVITGLMHELKLGEPAPTAARVDLGQALDGNRVEFWYQPKIDLRRKRLAGLESLARVRDVKFGVLPPAAFMPGATDDEIMRLSQLAVSNALEAGATLARMGVNLPIAVNLTVDATEKLPLADLVRMHQGQNPSFAGLIIDIPEDQIVSDLTRAVDLADRLAPSKVTLAVDNFGQNRAKLARLKKLPFVELKISRNFVTDCMSDKVNAPLCKAIIDLAHQFGRLAVGSGIERSADAVALTSMGCDIGQGFIFGKPMPQERFLSLLRQRSGSQSPPAAAPLTH
jgi:EAL domain-containing protein (putative c-di-GMP-specific phosphodiesterase class I)